MNNQAKRTKFVADTVDLILAAGGKQTSDINFELTGSNGTCTLTLYDESCHRGLYSIFGRFSYLNDLTGRTNFKYNFHSIEQDQENYLSEIINELNR